MINNKLPPDVCVIIDALRNTGYSFEAAVSDIIDNSIDAKATQIKVIFPINKENISLSIIDNGVGMSKEELSEAMKFGSVKNGLSRNETALGKFSLGLKTASLSQCSILTVLTKKNNSMCAMSWNIDTIKKENDWCVEELEESELKNIKEYEILSKFSSGTIVKWTNFDYLEKSCKCVLDELQSKMSELEKSLRIIFHRFINKNNFSLYINESKLKPLDPFLENHKKTKSEREILIPIDDKNHIATNITVRPFVLPYMNDLTDEELELSGGKDMFSQGQGLYIFRNDRLIVWGQWYKLSISSELNKYARISVDFPSSLDDMWEIDLKKQRAKIPNKIKDRLLESVSKLTRTSEKIQKHRTKKMDEGFQPTWSKQMTRDNKVLYKINRESVLVSKIFSELDHSQKKLLDLIFLEIENNLPYQDIYIDKTQSSIDDKELECKKNEDLTDYFSIFENFLVRKENDEKNAFNITRDESFKKYLELKNEKIECKSTK